MLRGLLRRFDDVTDGPQAMRPIAAAAPPAAIPQVVVSRQPAQPDLTPPPVPENPNEIHLPLQAVLATLPMDLRARVINVNTAGMTISIPIEKTLEQLATGSVKITFGEFRRLAPGVFANSGGEHDAKPVTLPLNQILAQINPALLARRPAQKQVVEVAGDVSSPFDGRGHGLKISTEALKAPVATPPPLSRFATPVLETPVQPRSVAPPPAATAFVQRAVTPAAPAVTPQNGAHKQQPAAQPAAFDTAFTPAINSAPKIPIVPVDQPVLAPLAALSESWPDALRMEIVQLNLTNAQVALPGNLVEPALKRGRVIFSWRYVRSWIRPTPPAVSVHDGIELELPLKVLAPLFFSRPKNGAASQKKVQVNEEIPNLFFGFPQAPSAAPEAQVGRTAPKPADAKLPDTNFYVWGENGEVPKIEESEYKRPQTPATDFLSRHATPKEVVARAMALPGVAGALVALPDGLMVASHIPPELNADTLAAFLPQIFDRVNQSTKELRMGALNNVHFTVGTVPWKIFRVNAVYFAAFGCAGQALPTMQLAAMAAELDRKRQQ
jgi:predicted regulator of Ras-like GTPase activity (Roadblock/LC7/MglB family)